jgi:hypothetical protein
VSPFHKLLCYGLDPLIGIAYQSESPMLGATIASSVKAFGTIGCSANHLNRGYEMPVIACQLDALDRPGEQGFTAGVDGTVD